MLLVTELKVSDSPPHRSLPLATTLHQPRHFSGFGVAFSLVAANATGFRARPGVPPVAPSCRRCEFELSSNHQLPDTKQSMA